MSADILSVAELPIVNGVGTVGYRVFDEESVQIIARTTLGITQILAGTSSAHYQAKITIATGVTAVTVVWDDASGNTEHDSHILGSANQSSLPGGVYTSALEATWGGNAADSYVDLDTADSLILDYVLDPTSWNAASGQKRDAALRMMTVKIDSFSYEGIRYSTAQTLKFPRWLPRWLYNLQDNQQTDVQRACAIGAAYLVTYSGQLSRHQRNVALGLKQVSESVGPIRDQYTYGVGAGFVLPPESYQLLQPYLSPKALFRA